MNSAVRDSNPWHLNHESPPVTTKPSNLVVYFCLISKDSEKLMLFVEKNIKIPKKVVRSPKRLHLGKFHFLLQMVKEFEANSLTPAAGANNCKTVLDIICVNFDTRFGGLLYLLLPSFLHH